jgi:hypothetical protein
MEVIVGIVIILVVVRALSGGGKPTNTGGSSSSASNGGAFSNKDHWHTCRNCGHRDHYGKKYPLNCKSCGRPF